MVAATKTAKRSCGTCRERRVYCDRILPTCSQCSRLKLTCKASAFRLSWPSDGDTRRSMVGKAHHGRRRGNPASKHLAHVSSWDIQMYRHLAGMGSPPQPLDIPMPFSSSALEMGNNDLIQYFHSRASQSLSTFGHGSKALGRSLMRFALGGATPSAAAVFNSLLAMASLHRYGVQEQAFQFKIATIRALAVAATSNLSAREVIQHAAAGMMLCTFEVHQASCTSSQWTWYISGVKSVLNSPCLKHFSRDNDLNALMDWVYYHDTLSTFIVRHWHREILEIPPQPSELSPKTFYLPMCTENGPRTSEEEVLCADKSMLANLELIADVSKMIGRRPREEMPVDYVESYRSQVEILDFRVRKLPLNTADEPQHELTHVAELFKLATLVYLNRMSNDILNQSGMVQAYLNRAFYLFSQMEGCERQYPLFLLGGEARSDEERLIVLDLISRTETRGLSRSTNHIRILLNALWAQHDLADSEVDYCKKLDSIITSCIILPSLT